MGQVILDASIVITFGNAAALSVVTELQVHSVVIGSRTRTEIVRDPAARELGKAIELGSMKEVSVDLYVAAEQAALQKYDQRIAFRGRGDAETLALASCRGYVLGSDDRAVRSTATADLGRGFTASTLDFLRWATAEARLSVPDAVALLTSLDVGPQVIRAAASQGKTPEDLFA